MKTFKDLEFKAHERLANSSHAWVEFGNGYGVSVVTGHEAYASESHPYELAVFKNNNIDYDHPESGGDVRKYLQEKDVTRIMKILQREGTWLSTKMVRIYQSILSGLLIGVGVTLLVSCGKNQTSRSELRSQINITCSHQSMINNCTRYTSNIRLNPQDFFGPYCFEAYRACIVRGGN